MKEYLAESSKKFHPALSSFELKSKERLFSVKARINKELHPELDKVHKEVFEAVEILFFLAIKSSLSFKAIVNELHKDPMAFREEKRGNIENLDELQTAFMHIDQLRDTQFWREKYGQSSLAPAAAIMANSGFVLIEETISQKYITAKEIQEKHNSSPPTQEPEGSGGSWLSRIEGAKSGRELG